MLGATRDMLRGVATPAAARLFSGEGCGRAAAGSGCPSGRSLLARVAPAKGRSETYTLGPPNMFLEFSIGFGFGFVFRLLNQNEAKLG